MINTPYFLALAWEGTFHSQASPPALTGVLERKVSAFFYGYWGNYFNVSLETEQDVYKTFPPLTSLSVNGVAILKSSLPFMSGDVPMNGDFPNSWPD